MKKIFLVLFVLFLSETRSQIAGSFTIPGSFPTIAAAINTLNIVGVAGPCTINIAAGYTETAPAGGYRLFNPIGISATNQVIFQKSGIGPNPLITAYTGTATPSSMMQDGVWYFLGTDYVTIDGIDITDPNTTNPSTMEFGYGFYKYAANDGCQYNTIKNCNISLNLINGATGSSTVNFGIGSRGIELACSSYTSTNFTFSPTAVAGTNSYNKFYSNTIRNCHTGISMIGHPNFPDFLNDIGGLTAATSNTILNFGGGTGGQTFGVRANSQSTVNVSNNYFNNNDGSGANPVTQLTAAYIGTVVGTYSSVVTANSNTIELSSSATSSVGMWGLYSQSGGGTKTVTCNNNIFPSYNYPNANNTQFNLIFVGGARIADMNNNFFTNLNVRPYSAVYLNAFNCSTVAINSNTAINIPENGFYFIAENGGSNAVINNNLLNNVSSSFFYLGGLTGISAGANTLTINSNTISNISGGGISCIEIGGGSKQTISNNIISNVSCGTGFEGLNVNGSPNSNITGNTIYSISCLPSSTIAPSVGNMTAMSFTNSTGANIERNKIYSMLGTGAGTVQGIRIYSSTPNIRNNVIGDIRATVSSNSLAVAAVATYSNSGVNMAFNSITLNNAVTSGTNSGNAVLAFISNGSFTLNNNIFINTSVATGTAKASVITRTSSTVGSYATSSNRNLFYTGAPAANRLMYYDVTNSYSTLFALKTGLSPREAQSVTENPPFVTTNGALPNTLDIDPSIVTQVESGAAPVPGITVDYNGTIRNTTTPDIGAWEGNFLQADVVPPVLLSSGFTGPACNTTDRTFTVSIKDTSGVATGTLSPKVYYRVNFSLYSSTQGTLTSGTPTLGVWTFSLNYSAALGDVIYYFLAFQDQSYVNNLSLVPSAGSSASDVNNVFIPPSSPNSYTIETYPTISVNSGTLCSGQNFTMTPNGASSYTFSSGSAIVSPTVTTSYSVTGSTPSGCLSTNTAVATITVFTSPVISVNSGSVCYGQFFTMTPSGAVTYSYSSVTFVVLPLANSTYTVVGFDALGCPSSPVISTVTVGTVTITANASSTAACSGSSITLFGGGSSSGYTWSGGIIDNTPFYPVTGGTYSVSGIGATGCPGSATIQISVIPSPTITAVAASNTICTGETATITASGASNSYTLYPGNIIGPQFLLTPTSTTNYTIVGSDVTGCTGTTTITLNVDLCIGINELFEANSLSIYPNPSSGVLNITNHAGNKLIIKMFDVSSRLIYQTEINTGSTTLHPDVSKGIYSIQIFENDKFIGQKKIIIE